MSESGNNAKIHMAIIFGAGVLTGVAVLLVVVAIVLLSKDQPRLSQSQPPPPAQEGAPLRSVETNRISGLPVIDLPVAPTDEAVDRSDPPFDGAKESIESDGGQPPFQDRPQPPLEGTGSQLAAPPNIVDDTPDDRAIRTIAGNTNYALYSIISEHATFIIGCNLEALFKSEIMRPHIEEARRTWTRNQALAEVFGHKEAFDKETLNISRLNIDPFSDVKAVYIVGWGFSGQNQDPSFLVIVHGQFDLATIEHVLNVVDRKRSMLCGKIRVYLSDSAGAYAFLDTNTLLWGNKTSVVCSAILTSNNARTPTYRRNFLSAVNAADRTKTFWIAAAEVGLDSGPVFGDPTIREIANLTQWMCGAISIGTSVGITVRLHAPDLHSANELKKKLRELVSAVSAMAIAGDQDMKHDFTRFIAGLSVQTQGQDVILHGEVSPTPGAIDFGEQPGEDIFDILLRSRPR